MADIICVPLMSARPSLASRTSGARPAAEIEQFVRGLLAETPAAQVAHLEKPPFLGDLFG